MLLIKFIGVFLIAYLALCLYLYFSQEKQILFPPATSLAAENIPLKNTISLTINGLTLNGIRSENINRDKPLIIYFGGNAEDVFNNLRDFVTKIDAQFIAINYRGFAGNDGNPSISHLVKDAHATVSAITKEFSLDPSHIFLMGRSLGAAIAVQISKNKHYTGLILISPFDSLANIGKRYFPFIPVSLILKHPLDSVAIGKQSQTPLLILAAEHDQIIPVIFSQILFNHWKSPEKRIEIIADTGHNTIHGGSHYFSAINDFVHRASH